LVYRHLKFKFRPNNIVYNTIFVQIVNCNDCILVAQFLRLRYKTYTSEYLFVRDHHERLRFTVMGGSVLTLYVFPCPSSTPPWFKSFYSPPSSTPPKLRTVLLRHLELETPYEHRKLHQWTSTSQDYNIR